jgi:hypothetical protein
LEVGAFFEAEGGGVEDGRDALDLGVISLRHFIEAAAFDGDAVFGAFELRLEGEEAGVGFEVRVAFDDDHEATEGAAEGGLGFFELLELGGVGGGVVELDFTDGGAGFGDFREGGFFEVGGAFDGFDEVGDEVGAALVNVLNLGPLGVDGFLGGDEAVVAAHDDEGDDDEEADEGEERFHDGWASIGGEVSLAMRNLSQDWNGGGEAFMTGSLL